MPFDVPDPSQPSAREAAAQPRADGADFILAALGYVRGGVSPDGSAHGSPSLARQKEGIRQWAGSLGLLLKQSDLPPKVVRGGQEHDLYHDEATDRYFKVTRDGIFGLSPGIDLALVSSDMDARRFHLWEASPLEYLERLLPQNELVPGLNKLEGIIDQGDDLAIVTSQPRFDIIPVPSGWRFPQIHRRHARSGPLRHSGAHGQHFPAPSLTGAHKASVGMRAGSATERGEARGKMARKGSTVG